MLLGLSQEGFPGVATPVPGAALHLSAYPRLGLVPVTFVTLTPQML